jgi:hypothetical protein
MQSEENGISGLALANLRKQATMMSAPRGRWAALLFLPAVLGLAAGCSSTSTPSKSEEVEKKDTDDPLQEARQVVRQATEPGAYQPALEVVNGYLAAHKDALAPYQVGPKDRPLLLKALGKLAGADAEKLDAQALERKLLSERVGLEEDELREVEADRCSPLDAYYLDFCFQLRDAARSLRQGERAGGGGRELTQLEQVRQAFDWVMREVALETRSWELQPPEFALRQGHGGPHERALVFLALLRQMDFDGCMIAYPTKGGPVYWLAGVLLAEKDASPIYLFDTRLGLPVPGPDGGVATLAQLRQQPDLLKRLNAGAPYDYDVTPAQAKEAEVHLVLPLSALAARMRFLEDEVFAAQDRVNLAVRAYRLLEHFQAADGREVHIWNRRGQKDQPRPLTPTRVLRESLPKQEGGVDPQSDRFARHQRSRFPWSAVLDGFKEMKLDEELPIALKPLQELVIQLIHMYIWTPQQQILRGRFDDASKRLVRLERVLEEYDTARPDGAAFAEQLAQWRGRVRTAFQGGKEKQAREAMWDEDPRYDLLALTLRSPEEPEVERQKLRKGTVGFIIFRAAGDTFRKEIPYLQALLWQEKAERLQARLGRLASGKGPAKGTKSRLALEDAWRNTEASWGQYEDANKVTPAVITGRVLDAVSTSRARDDESARSMLAQLVRELRRSLTAQVLHARALRASGKDRKADAVLQGLLTEAKAVAASKELQAVREEMMRRVGSPKARELVETELFGDLLPSGSLHWIAYRARLELRTRSGK